MDLIFIRKKIILLSVMTMILSFFVSWVPPFFFEMFPPKNVKKVTQIRLKPDGTEFKAGQTIREFSPKGQLVKLYWIESGPQRDSVHLEAGPVGELDQAGRVVRYRTQPGTFSNMSADLFYNNDSSMSYLAGDSSYCVFAVSGKIISIITYRKTNEIQSAVTAVELKYNKEGLLIEELQLVANKFDAMNDAFPGDSLLESEKLSWVYNADKKQRLITGYKLRYNNQFSINDTIEKRITNKKDELVKTVTYENHRSRYRNEKDSTCFIYKYEYY